MRMCYLADKYNCNGIYLVEYFIFVPIIIFGGICNSVCIVNPFPCYCQKSSNLNWSIICKKKKENILEFERIAFMKLALKDTTGTYHHRTE